MRFTVRYSVSGTSLNLRCTSTSQSMRIARIFSLMCACCRMYVGLTLVSSSFSRKWTYLCA